MENLSMKLSSKTMKNLVSNLITKALCKKLGNDLILNIKEFELSQDSGVIRIDANVHAEIPLRTLTEILTSNLG